MLTNGAVNPHCYRSLNTKTFAKDAMQFARMNELKWEVQVFLTKAANRKPGTSLSVLSRPLVRVLLRQMSEGIVSVALFVRPIVCCSATAHFRAR